MFQKLRSSLSGKKTYILCGIAILHGCLDWWQVLPARGIFDAGKTTASAEILSALALITFRCGLAKAVLQIQQQLDRLPRK
jgi:hypothetical protein